MSRYFPGADGRRFFYASEATMVCEWDPSSPEREQEILARLEQEPMIFGFDAVRLLRRAHRGASVHDDVNPNVCRSCGMPLVKIGYRTWIEEPIPDDADDASALVGRRLGFIRRIKEGSARYQPLKRDAIQWARENADIDKSAERERLAKEEA